MSATIIDFATRLPQREHLPDDVDYSSPTFLCYLHAVNWKFRREGKRYPLYDDVVRDFAVASRDEREAVMEQYRAWNRATT